MSRARLEKLKEQIDRLEPQEHAQIFAIIKKYTDSYTQTQSGALVSSDVLSEQCITEMERMVLFYIDQRKHMEAERLGKGEYWNKGKNEQT
jgi:hypothetical protein